MDPTGPFRSESTAGAASGTFELHGRSGSVWVTYGVNADSRSVGLWHSGVALYDPILARGFPVIEALVRYSGEGSSRSWHGSRSSGIPTRTIPWSSSAPRRQPAVSRRRALFDALRRPSTARSEAHWRGDDFPRRQPRRGDDEVPPTDVQLELGRRPSPRWRRHAGAMPTPINGGLVRPSPSRRHSDAPGVRLLDPCRRRTRSGTLSR